jgi:chromosome segregation ATPase
MKVPEMIGKLRVADKTNKELEGQVADLTESSEEMTSELNELQKELTTVTIAKLVLETDKAGYTKNLVEARQAVRELREHGSTDYSIDEIEETLQEPSHEETPEATHKPAESKEDVPSGNVWE